MSTTSLLSRMQAGLIVSCQAMADEPLYGPQHMVAMARAAAFGGAVGLRVNTPKDIHAVRLAVDLPIIGIWKDDIPGFAVRITPTLEHARKVATAGAHIIAIDATDRPHPDGLSLEKRISRIHDGCGRPVLADVATVDEGLAAWQAGADLVATTLSGYTDYSPPRDTPDFELLEQLVARLHIPVMIEGHVSTPEQARHALELGAFAVVVGAAITRPQWITARFVDRIKAP